MRAIDVIRKKRDGGALTKGELDFFVEGFIKGTIPDYQASALLMAVFMKGMDEGETLMLTDAMLRSGRVLDLSGIPGVKVDKHSTGGVGDKVSLILAPLAASAGVVVPMLAGRGLGHTGGTLDKLSSIPGFNTSLTAERFAEILRATGAAVMGQTAEIAPADGRLYSLRDVTATVESIPLIAASIMSKKLAEGTDALVFDVKAGCGAFMKTYDDAERLGRALVSIAKGAGRRAVALITEMDEPLGLAVGNALEVVEAVDALSGRGPSDLMEVTSELAAWMLVMAGVEPDTKRGRARLLQLIKGGAAFEKFCEMVEAQGGDAGAVRDTSKLPHAREKVEVRSERAGFVRHIDAGAVGVSAMMLGAGREKAEDKVDPAVGIMLARKVGDKVLKGDTLAVMHVSDRRRLEDAKRLLAGAFELGIDMPARRPLVHKVIG